MMNPNAKLTLVGAGPGDPDLITLKGLNALKKADVILYDALVNPVLLDHAPQNPPDNSPLLPYFPAPTA